MKKLILTILLLCSTSLFSAGFNTPMEAFNFYYKVAVKAAAYKDKNGHFSKKHINILAPHIWSKRNPPERAAIALSQHRSYILRALNLYSNRYPMIVKMRYKGPIYDRDYKKNGVVKVYYTYYDFQHKKDKYRKIKIKAKKIENKIKWFII